MKKALDYQTTQIWRNQEQFNIADDETLANWKEQSTERDKENAAIHSVRVAEYRKAQESIATLWGRKSKQYRYLDKQSISGYAFSITHFYTQAFDRSMSHRNKIRDEAEQDKKRKEQKQVASEAHDKQVRECLKIAIRYEADENSGAWELLDLLLDKNKYLNLACAMMRTRNDWNDGCGSVRSALRDFKIESDQDKLIHVDVSECCEDFDDGRVFRDTEWNYGRLFELVDKQLYEDAMALYEFADIW